MELSPRPAYSQIWTWSWAMAVPCRRWRIGTLEGWLGTRGPPAQLWATSARIGKLRVGVGVGYPEGMRTVAQGQVAGAAE